MFYLLSEDTQARHPSQRERRGERKFFVENLLVRIHLVNEMILVDRPCGMVSSDWR